MEISKSAYSVTNQNATQGFTSAVGLTNGRTDFGVTTEVDSRHLPDVSVFGLR